MGRLKINQAANPVNQRMAELRAAGMTLVQIGEIYGVTRERVRQRLSYLGLTREDSGRAKEVAKRRETKKVAVSERRDQRCLQIYGCTYTALETILGAGVELTKNKGARAYWRHKMNSSVRQIEFSLTFPQWWAVWQKSGKWSERGRARYVMARNGDIGPYAVGNVYICTSSQNIKDSYLKTPGNIRAAKAATNPSKSTLGRGKGWTYREGQASPYYVHVAGKHVGCFKTEEDARHAYLAACERRRKEHVALLEAAA